MQITAINSNYQTPKTQLKNNSQVNFRGRLGTKMLEKAGGLELKSVLSEITGFFGLKTTKVKDVLESFIERINIQEKASKVMKQDIASKGNKIAKLEEENKTLEQQNEILKTSLAGRDERIFNLQRDAIKKDEEIAYLEPYRKMLAVKPINEIGVLMPDEVIEIIKMAKANESISIQSAYEFAMTGKGQEALLEQINRSNAIQKAFEDGMKDFPKLRESVNDMRFGFGYDQEALARSYFVEALQRNKEGSYLVSKSIKSQIEQNIEAFLAPLRNPKYSYNPVFEITNKALKYHQNLEVNKEEMVKRFNMKFEKIITVDTESLPETYYVYTNRNGDWLRISERNLASGCFGYVERLPE